MKKHFRALIVCQFFTTCCYAVATVELTADTTVVAKGGSINFTVTVTPGTYVDRVILNYGEPGSDDIDTSAPYSFSHTFNSTGSSILITATVEYTNGDPDGQDTLYVDVVSLAITGTSTPWRGWPTSYTAESDPAGYAISQFNWKYEWTWPSGTQSNTFQDNDADDDDKSSWNGNMVVNGTLSCQATVAGVNVSDSMTITVSPRSWSTPIACYTDNESSWGDNIRIEDPLGQNRDRDSDVGVYIFTPRNGAGSFTSARTLGQVDGGPCDDIWYVTGSTLKCVRETVINRYIKYGGPLPSGASENFYDRNNAYCFTDPGESSSEFVTAVENHEYRGTPSTYQSDAGHQGRIEKWIPAPTDGAPHYDAKKSIEPLTAATSTALSELVDTTIGTVEQEVIDFALDESYFWLNGPNWGSGDNALGWSLHAVWDPNTSSWTGCTAEPDEF